MAIAGTDVGGTNIVTVVLDDDDAIIGRSRLRTPTHGDRLAVIDVLETGLHSAAEDAGAALEDLVAVGMGSPGVVIGSTVGGAPNVPGWSERFSLADMIGDRIGRPVRLVNDVTAAAVGEHRRGAAQGADDALVVSVGTGVGAGLIVRGAPYEGVNGGAGEFGHMVVERDGAECPCGRRGCVEAYAGRLALERAASRAVADGRQTVLYEHMERLERHRPTSSVFHAALQAGDPLTTELLESAVAALGAGIASAVNLLDVPLVVLGGGLADRLGDWFRNRVEAAMRPHLFLQPPVVRLVAGDLGDDAGPFGAALLARERT